MDKINIKKYAKIMAFAVTIAAIYFAGGLRVGTTANAQPGAPHDPLVSRSYLNTRIAALEDRLNEQAIALAALTASGMDAPVAPTPPAHTAPALPVPAAPTLPAPATPALPASAVQRELFTVVRAYPGTALIGGASTEIILRAGEATAITGLNGLANVTAGHDLMNGQTVPLNHLLIVPAGDGRGLHFHTVCYLLVKGDFHFE